MSQDEQADKLKTIKADLAYFKKACSQQGVGSQPPTIYAAKYAEDIEFLLNKIEPPGEPVALPPPPPSPLEEALVHDEAGRTERKPKRG